MFDKTCDRFQSKKAFTNFGKSISFNEIYIKSQNLAKFLQNPQVLLPYEQQTLL